MSNIEYYTESQLGILGDFIKIRMFASDYRQSVRVRGPVVDPWGEKEEQGACGSSSMQT